MNHPFLSRPLILLAVCCSIVAAACSHPVRAEQATERRAFTAAVRSVKTPPPVLWRERNNTSSLNLLYGAGGKEHQPSGPFTFVKEDLEGSAPKFEIVDAQGAQWKVKLGEEAKPETAATRLVWAAGYFTDEDYFLPEIRVAKMPKLHRGRQYVSKGGVVRGARLERHIKGQKKTGNWSWSKNAFAGTRELNGLRTMMALINNWDLKDVNNAIYDEQGQEVRYAVGDLGATFGRTGNALVRSKNDLRDYRGTKFVEKVKPEEVEFHLRSRPFFLTAVDVPYYVTRTKMQGVVKHIPRTHAKWLGQQLGRLSAEQIRDCFRAAAYSPEEVDGFVQVVQGRIADLNRL